MNRAGSFGRLALELSLMAVTVATALGLGRLFESGSVTVEVVAAAVTAHLLASVALRSRLNVAARTTILLGLGVVVVSWMTYPETLWGPFPTAATFGAAASDLADSFGRFGTLVAPVPLEPGFDLALIGGFFLIGLYSGSRALLSRSGVISVLPQCVVFVAGSILARGEGFEFASVVFIASLLLLALVLRAERVNNLGWEPATRRLVTAQQAAGSVAALLAVSIAVILAIPAATNLDQLGAIDLRRLGPAPSSLTVDSPLVSIQSLLNEQSESLMFTVQSDSGHYWRQTALEDFDGTSWSSDSTYRDQRAGSTLGRELPSFASDPDTPSQSTTVRIENLRSNWIPLPYATTSIDTPFDVRYDPASESIFVNDGSEEVRGEAYSSVYIAPDIDDERLAEAGVDLAPDDYRLVPRDLSQSAVDLADRILESSDTPYEAALALQNYFRSNGFAYDTTVDYRDSPDALASFLSERVGFCQQFASTYAAVARQMGLPSRVAVGFTEGDVDADDPDRRLVRGRNAHSWPEVYFDEVGWMAFEPTPGRGNPDATPYTGIEPDQAGPPAPTSTAPATTLLAPQIPGAPVAPGSTTTSPPAQGADDPAGESKATDTPGTGGRWTPLIVAAIGLSLLAAAAAAWWSLARRPAPDGPPGTRVETYWKLSCKWIGTQGLSPENSETPREFMERGSAATGLASLNDLARIETERRWGAGSLEAEDAERARTVFEELVSTSDDRIAGWDALRLRRYRPSG